MSLFKLLAKGVDASNRVSPSFPSTTGLVQAYLEGHDERRRDRWSPTSPGAHRRPS